MDIGIKVCSVLTEFRQKKKARNKKMGKQKKTRGYAVAKKVISLKDSRLKQNKEKEVKRLKQKEEEEAPRHVDQTPSALWFQYNTALGPPYHGERKI
jgi:hypothetical protein